MRPYLATFALAAALAGSAQAATTLPGDDEVIATAHAKMSAKALTAVAPDTPPAVSTTPPRPLTTQEQIAAFIAANAPAEDAPRGVLPAERDEDGKRKVHGSMGVSVGTGGYRSAYASALFPVGESATIGVAVSKTDFGKHGGWYGGPGYGAYGPGYGYGYDYGYGYGHAPGFGRVRGGERQSIALSVMTGGSNASGGVPDGCAPGFRSGGRYVEPLWVEGMRDGAHPCAGATPSR
ncbi:MAG: hypothetical protein ACOVOE_01820 [Caulobacter sp.]